MAVQTRRRTAATAETEPGAKAAMLRISSRNYSSWSMRGWLLCRMAGIAFEEEVVSADDVNSRAELLLQSSSILHPRLRHEGAELWDTLAIAEYLNSWCRRRGCCRRTGSPAPAAAPSAARCMPASPRCARPCR